MDEKYHGTKGPMGVRKLPKYSCKMSSLIEASLNDTLGLQKGDCNGKNQNVIYQSQFNQNSGRRADSYSCFAEPHVGRGLTVLTYAHVTQILISNLILIRASRICENSGRAGRRKGWRAG